MYTAIIIDDEFHAQEGLKKLIHHALPNMFSQILIASSVNSGVELIREFKPDIVFLDIHMPNEYGFKLFDYFDQINFEVIFTTAHSNYILEAVNQWGCLGYLMKPVSVVDLKNLLHRFEQIYAQKKESQYQKISSNLMDDFEEAKEIKSTLNQDCGILLYSSVTEISFIRIDEIIYCKAADNYCEIYTTSKMYIISKPLKEIEKAIARNYFARIHRSYLVNLSFAMRMDKRSNTLFLKNPLNEKEDLIVPVTASGLKILMNAIS